MAAKVRDSKTHENNPTDVLFLGYRSFPTFTIRIMRYFIVFLFLCFSFANTVQAQADLFGATQEPRRKGLVLGFNGGIDWPAADMAKRFGLSYRFGPSVQYKTKSNWLFGAKFDFIQGNRVHQDSLLSGVSDPNGLFINQDGQRIAIGLFERGYAVALQAGKIFPTDKHNPNTGILVLTGLGFMQHRIDISDVDKTIPQLRGQYEKGYDRLTNGIFVEQFAGFNMFDKGGFINFHLGLDILAGFTQGRRSYLYDVRRPDNESRLDILFGIRGGMYIPIFKKKSEEYFFE
ncbi:MAG: hypothetical protein JST36_08520 [Bacteroidetes bacterium]|nr:hypothetical protein [Bacteroidota bacterium]